MSFSSKPKKHQGEDARDFDKTSLKYNQHGAWVHRDYASHFFRWGFAARMIKGGAKVLDIGCGTDQALVRILCYKPSGLPKKLIGVDYARVTPKFNPAWFELKSAFDFTTRWKELKKDGPFDVITCFEVIEHMQKAHGAKMLKGCYELLTPKTGRLMLSTPVYDKKTGMAQNHIHEYGVDELQKSITKAGLYVEKRFGTFQTVLQAKQTQPEHRRTWEALRSYYSDDVLACFLAPLYPELARNNFWLCQRLAP